MPNRFIKESCRSSKNLDKITDFEERLFWRLITTADDFGRFQACPSLVRASCFPYRSIALVNIEKALLGLQNNSLIILYSVGDRQYGEFSTWVKHQGKARARHSKYPNRLGNSMLADESNCLQVNVVPDNLVHGPNTDTDTDTDLSSLNSSLNSSESEFEQFWKAYPRKVGGKRNALRVWGKAKDRPSIQIILQAIMKAKQTEQWKKDGGQFIPYPATWLNRGSWDDEPVETLGNSDPNGFLAGLNAFIARGAS